MPDQIGDFLAPHTSAIQEAGKALLSGDSEAATKALIRLATGLATCSPALGALSSELVAGLFASTATKRLKQAIEEADGKERREAFIRGITAPIEALLGEFLVQLVRVHHNVKDELVAQLGGREELAGFGAEVASTLARCAVHVERIEVSDGGLGICVSASGREAFARELHVWGKGSVGIKL